MLNLPEVVIASVSRPDRNAVEVQERLDESRIFLNTLGVEYREGEGIWQGETEPCFVIIVRDDVRDKVASYFLNQHNQDCVLHLTTGRTAILEYQDRKLKKIGPWRNVGSTEAARRIKQGKGCTLCNGEYYCAG